MTGPEASTVRRATEPDAHGTEPVRVLIVRHGETQWNADGRIQGQTDVHLSDRGEMQARALVPRLADELIARSMPVICNGHGAPRTWPLKGDLCR